MENFGQPSGMGQTHPSQHNYPGQGPFGYNQMSFQQGLPMFAQSLIPQPQMTQQMMQMASILAQQQQQFHQFPDLRPIGTGLAGMFGMPPNMQFGAVAGMDQGVTIVFLLRIHQ